MRFYRYLFRIINIVLLCTVFYNIPAYTQSVSTENIPKEEWNIHHSSTIRHHNNAHLPVYHKKPALYPAKKGKNNRLRKEGWHTHPDPYIEEGGVYTHEEHPAVTDTQGTMRDYTTGDPNHYIAPPSTIINMPYAKGQQRVKIKDPLPEKLPPITLPAT